MSYFVRLTLFVMVLVLPTQAVTVQFQANYPREMPELIRRIFQEATEKAYSRLFASPEVSRCISQNTRIGYIDPPTVEARNGREFFDAGKLFDEQIRVMRQHVTNKVGLPPITFTQVFDDKTFAYAWAHYGLVWTTAIPGRVFWHGAFEMTINVAKILDGDVDVWAGIIAHEMLHNMMHAHQNPAEVGIEHAYRSEVLINTAQNCITRAVEPRNYASAHRCGGREPK